MCISISQVSFEHHREPLGIAEAEPRISWRFEGDVLDWEQAGYDIEIARVGCSEPSIYAGNVSDSLYVSWPGAPLAAAESAKVRVRAHGGAGQPSTEWSEPYVVETGLIGGEWGGAVPIAADRETELGQPKAPVHFRTDFSLGEGELERARLYITALGLYEAEINGQRVGENVLAPGWQSYNFRHVYDTYDVTSLLQEGGNAIGVTVGEGWYAGRMGFAYQREHWGDTLGVQALLRVYAAGGSVVTSVPTNTSWSASTGPILSSEIYNGEVYDSRLEADIEGWSSAGFSPEAEWLGTKELPTPKGPLVPPDGPPIRILQEIAPQRIFQSPSGKTLIDFGQNLVGWIRLQVEGEAGTNITLKHAEVLEDGELALVPLRTAKATDTLILNGNGPQMWEPHFTFHGFRYAQVEGWPEGVPLDGEGAVTARVIYSDMEETGWFSCSHELLTKFHSNVRWSMRGNFLSVPTDCPQRDERLGWTGDAHAFGPTANFLYDTAGFWRGWHKDMWSEMQREDSMIVPFFVPTLPTDGSNDPAAYWGDVAVGGPWNLYRAFGDSELLREQLPQARGWIDTGVRRTGPGELWNRSGMQYGDWLDPAAPADNAGAATTHQYLVADAYLTEMTRVLAEMSSALGEDELAAEYSSQHDSLKTQFQQSWIVDGSEGWEMVNHTQTAYALALEFGLHATDAQRDEAIAALLAIIEDNDHLVGTGFAGTPALGPALSRFGAEEDFYAMLLQTRVPSWLFQVAMNGTTTWERWDSMLANGSVNVGSMTSFNHYAFGAVADWVHGVVGGLRPAEPGWRVVEVAPVPGGGITRAEARHLSGYGEVSVGWSVDEAGGFAMEVKVPPNTRARVTVPGEGGEETEVGSGSHTFANPNFGRRK